MHKDSRTDFTDTLKTVAHISLYRHGKGYFSENSDTLCGLTNQISAVTFTFRVTGSNPIRVQGRMLFRLVTVHLSFQEAKVYITERKKNPKVDKEWWKRTSLKRKKQTEK
jgi:hypothetical protein